MPQHKTVEETATTAEENPVEEAATVAKTVKNSESGNILDIFNPNKKGTATGDDQQQPANIFDLFKPKTDDAGSDQKKGKVGKPKEVSNFLDPFHLKDKIDKIVDKTNDKTTESDDNKKDNPINLLDPFHLKDKIDKIVDKTNDKTTESDDNKKDNPINLLDPFHLKDKIDKIVDKTNDKTIESDDNKKDNPINLLDPFNLKDKIVDKTNDKTTESDDNQDSNHPIPPNPTNSKNTDDKKTDVKPLFPSDDPFNLKKTIEDAQQAMKEKGLGGLIQSVQQNVQATCTALFVDGGAQQIIESVIVWFKDLMKIIEEKGIPAVMSQVVEKIKEILAKSIIENNKWPAKALTQV
ncbi:probable replication factor C subunit 1 isoform X2 [Diorhabda sublineata]|uniref:probable replication factor C subunit 1 isoform X2 n=1 Tax=Diorhabda sublineata TaxID=1163346 RepID=UPI0024E07943|nr:probable replication factor C subunit 1 isoform X2 [Diorhabda sublineata]